MKRSLALLVCLGCRSPQPPLASTVSLAPAATTGTAVALHRARRSMVHVTRIADLPGQVDALAASSATLFAVSTESGAIRSIDWDTPDPVIHVVASGEHEPNAVVVRDGQPVWASADGLFAGRPRRALASGQVTALANAPDGLYFAMDRAIWRLDWPRTTTPVAVVRDASADEIVVAGGSVVFRDGRRVTRFDLASKTTTELDGRKPHDLSTDGRFVLYHEGEADLLPGRESRAFVFDTHGWTETQPPGDWSSSDDYVIEGGRVYGARACKAWSRGEWHRFESKDGDTSVGASPVAVGGHAWFWVELVCANGTCGEASRIYGLDQSACDVP